MDEKKTLIKMLKVLSVDVQNIPQKGSGYYACGPFVQRYNRLLGRAKAIFKDNPLMETFTEIDDTKSPHPDEKLKTIQGVTVETQQLIAFIEASLEGG